MDKKWMIKNKKINADNIVNELNISHELACLLQYRDLKDKNEIVNYLNPSINNLHSGKTMKDMEKGVEIIKNAIDSGKKIAVYGDYDVDGIISTYILYSAIIELGGDAIFHLPDRENEGYGMNSNRIKILKDEGIEVIISCDNGIAAFEEIDLIKSFGMEVVITDHHDIPLFKDENGEVFYKIPNADAVINPKQEDCPYEFKKLCGGGVVLKFIGELYKSYGIDEIESYKYIEFAAIATVCDVVELTCENRIIVKHGLEMINNTKNIGLKSLIKNTGLENKNITEYHLGFVIGPCINATGRLEKAKIALNMLLSKNEDEGDKLSQRLCELNRERQQMTVSGVESSLLMIDELTVEKNKVLVIYNDEIHESIAGIVAGRIKEKYNVPTIIITNGKDFKKASGRSIEEYDMFSELSKLKELLERFGGHPLAAGFSIKSENINSLREGLINNCTLTIDDITPKLRIDLRVNFDKISFKLIDELKLLKPFGKGNEAPTFACKNVEFQNVYFIGKEKKILKFYLRQNNMRLQGISFSGYDKFKSIIESSFGIKKFNEIFTFSNTNINFDICYYPEINEYNGNKTIQLHIIDFRLSSNI